MERENKKNWLLRLCVDKVKLHRFWVDAGGLDSRINQNKWILVAPDFYNLGDKTSICSI